MTLSEARRLMGCAERFGGQNCTAAAAILLYAGIRPREVRRLKWRDIDIAENSITVRSACSKTGGARQVEICPALKVFLGGGHPPEISVCPPDWPRRWKRIRDGGDSGTHGYRTCCGTRTRATMRNASATCRGCNPTWGTATSPSCAPDTSTCAASLPPTHPRFLKLKTG